MQQNKHGKQSFILPVQPVISAWASTAGKKENQGPFADKFDIKFSEAHLGQNSWEQGENKMQELTLHKLLDKSKLKMHQIDAVFSGDLLNQCIGSSFTLRNTGIAHIGLYGACSTMAESLVVASMAISGGFVNRAIAMTSSHFASSERQYRFPLGYGGQRAPTAQWTVTGCGAVLLTAEGSGPRIESCTIGTVCDLGITDANNMGAAMAPAALSTIRTHFEDMHVTANDYDMIVTGDLGIHGKQMLLELARRDGLELSGKLSDCGCMIFDPQKQDVHSGGSGCGCSAVVLCSSLLNDLRDGKLKRILFCGTGALLSPTSTQQSLPIPGVCHAVSICCGRK